MAVLQSINLALAFLLELGMLAAFAYWGFHTGSTVLTRLLLGVGVPLAAAVIWWLFMAPKATRRLQGTAYLVVKVILFGLAATALAEAGLVVLAIVFAVLFVVNTILLYAWE